MRIGIITSNDTVLSCFIQPQIMDHHHLIHFDSEEKFQKNDQHLDVIFVDDELINYSSIDINTIDSYLISSIDSYSYFKKTKAFGFSSFLLNDDQLEINILKSLVKYQATSTSSLPTDYSYLIKGKSEAMKKVFDVMEKAIKTIINVNIVGETGTGKELIAQAVHQNSPRKLRKFVAINVASIPNELIESELFGYEEGAFTGATKRREGKFEEAEGGTLFLDEIGELPLDLQSKLLRVLQEREITRIGSNEVIPINVRLITATHKNLLNEVSEGKFREDLYYRLLGLPIELPPLRERKEDIIPLSQFFIENYISKNSNIPQKSLTNEAKQKLEDYSFPGNIRQLRALIELAITLADENEIRGVDILLEKVEFKKDLLEKERTLEEYNIEIIEYFLKKYKGRVNYVKDILNISKSKIYQLIKDGKISR
ncbi:sigma-54 interaction domain-containing protein [Flammeovirga pacifica]|uniref:Sigma-54 factor interaction domain-containing protein n=1 Tax=Flammeovirga pacifica TaxID=915059 RepID=A0A1S1YWE3_FLAPC|nr:sigma-54 dependent transcriptional regulator [Flammeovirga pacifica]OHX65341.1 hypothetical protein NH26_02740 [Flammeovirga pacifica]